MPIMSVRAQAPIHPIVPIIYYSYFFCQQQSAPIHTTASEVGRHSAIPAGRRSRDGHLSPPALLVHIVQQIPQLVPCAVEGQEWALGELGPNLGQELFYTQLGMLLRQFFDLPVPRLD